MTEIKVRKETLVVLRECSQKALDSLGTLDTLRVNGDLNLYDCKGITKLPDGLKVNGYLYLLGCTRLTKLPDDLKVVGELYFNNCSGITKLPDDLHTGEKIFYDSETGFYGHEDEPGVIPERLKHKLKYTEW